MPRNGLVSLAKDEWCQWWRRSCLEAGHDYDKQFVISIELNCFKNGYKTMNERG